MCSAGYGVGRAAAKRYRAGSYRLTPANPTRGQALHGAESGNQMHILTLV